MPGSKSARPVVLVGRFFVLILPRRWSPFMPAHHLRAVTVRRAKPQARGAERPHRQDRLECPGGRSEPAQRPPQPVD